MDALWSVDEWQEEAGPPPSLLRDEEVEVEQVEVERTRGERELEVEVIRSSKRRKSVSARIVDGKVIVRMPQWMTKAQEAEYVASMIDKLRRQHRAEAVDLTVRAAELARRYELPVPRSIRWVGNQQQRWGSCSPHTGEIRISDRISGFPGWVIDAVLVHELAHLVEIDHGPAFHTLANRYPKQERAHGYLLAMELTDDDLDG